MPHWHLVWPGDMRWMLHVLNACVLARGGLLAVGRAGRKGGWDGGSHEDAIVFCQQFAGSHGTRMNICPYAAYCPQGPTKPVLGGHDANFDEEGEQWAPLYGQSNHWVMIGKKGTNMSTTCLTHVQLNGEKPEWGDDRSHKELKQHLMCCSSLQ